MQQCWGTTFGDFEGAHLYICSINSPRIEIGFIVKSSFNDFLQTLSLESRGIYPVVELVIASASGFLTDIQHLCAFFEDLDIVTVYAYSNLQHH